MYVSISLHTCKNDKIFDATYTDTTESNHIIGIQRNIIFRNMLFCWIICIEMIIYYEKKDEIFFDLYNTWVWITSNYIETRYDGMEMEYTCIEITYCAIETIFGSSCGTAYNCRHIAHVCVQLKFNLNWVSQTLSIDNICSFYCVLVYYCYFIECAS